MIFLDEDHVRKHLSYKECITVVRAAMTEFSIGKTQQLLRSILNLGDGRMFGVMPGAMPGEKVFGAKLVSVFPENFGKGRPSHQGVVMLFDFDSGEPVCVVDATSITAIRTGAASAAATDALAVSDASVLTLLGYGDQALTHTLAISEIRDIEEVTVWGRSKERAQLFVERLHAATGFKARVFENAEDAVREADIICTLTSAQEPILESAWVKPGAHVNAVGSSHAGPVEIDIDLVARARFFADSKEGVLAQGAEFLRAREAGLIGDDHIVGEIGEVFAGTLEGRQSADQVTIYKSLGHVVQDLATASMLYRGAIAGG